MSDRYITTAAGFLFCRDCGSLVMEGYRTIHDRMHPVISCDGLGCGVSHSGGHPWETVFPRQEDTRADS